ncbi:hypothetical protein C8Q75DRAFT_807068 [Abortiporus biennis]|nr:hypothetical protein C8Q75DRAFT_807068 [Abortiporus biennis]
MFNAKAFLAAFVVLAANMAMSSAEAAPPDPTPTTLTLTATRLYETLVPTPPFLVTKTTNVVWTVTRTFPYSATGFVEKRAHARDFQAYDA